MHFPACLCSTAIALFITAGFTIAIIMGSCSRDKCSVAFRFTIGKNMVEGYALLRQVFENVSAKDVFSCFEMCHSNCRCVSFNFLANLNRDNCQLNEENRHLKPGSIKAKEGSHYYDLVAEYRVKGQIAVFSPCAPCSNGCCRDQPCLNGGVCQEKCETLGKRFICDCRLGFVGQLCQNDCQLVQEALGMESGLISDGQITASKEYSESLGADDGRLNGPRAWKTGTNNRDQWLQIDLVDKLTTITRIATQGRPNYSRKPQWVTKYHLQYSNDKISFQYYKAHGQNATKDFTGNTDMVSVVYHDLNPPIRARFIRFLPVAWNKAIAMRVELYGCHG